MPHRTARILDVLACFNDAHPWSHNDAFTGFVLRNARAMRRDGGTVAVDVGCGTGNLLHRLSDVFPTVIGIEPDIETATTAAQRFNDARVRVQQRPFGDEPESSYDFVAFVASLHHMSLRETLRGAKTSLRPGGRLVIVGVARETRADAGRSAVSMLLNPIVGLIRHPARAVRFPAHMAAPTAAPHETFEEIRTIARAELPGITMRRRLFWRYTAVWRAPRGTA